jgi:hypothetical protein
LVITASKNRRIKSSRIVEDDDDLLGFVAPDDRSPPTASAARTSLTVSMQSQQRTRDWSDIVNLSISGQPEVLIDDAIGQLARTRGEKSPHLPLKVLADMLPESRIPDIEEASSLLSTFKQEAQTTDDRNGGLQHAWKILLLGTESLLENYNNIAAKYVRHLSAELPERVRVQTERLCRNAALDQDTSLFVEIGVGDHPTQTLQIPSKEAPSMPSSPPSSPAPTAAIARELSEPALAVLKRYTTISDSAVENFKSTSTSNILAHLPGHEILDPEGYSYTDVEDRLSKTRTQQELDDLDERARRRADRAVLREEKRKLRQANVRDTVTQQSIAVPGLVVSSPQTDPREVQSSQLAPIAASSSQPGVPMTQPERGAHGERRRVKKKEGKHRIKGF